MRIALYNENAGERQEMERQLRACGREALRRVDVTAFSDRSGFCRAVQDVPERFDLLVVAQDGTHSLETLDYLQARGVSERAAWFSDLDFGVRSYSYRVLWFARKPVSLSTMQKVFDRAAGYRAHATEPGG